MVAPGLVAPRFVRGEDHQRIVENAQLAEAIHEVRDRDVLIRMQNNLKIRALRESRLEDAVLVLERLLLLEPGNGVFWQETGLIHQRLGNLRAAVLAFENAVETMQEPALSIRVQSLLDEVRSQLN